MTRQALTDEQRKAIRKYYYITRRKAHDQRAVISWFERTYKLSLSQPQVSKILIKQYAYLDQLPETDNLTQKKRRLCIWPELERALFTWQQAMQQRKAALAGEHLKAKASDFWSQLAVYQGKPVPSFSSGWLERFKNHRKIRSYVRHGEAG
jgi:hypothetical protein